MRYFCNFSLVSLGIRPRSRRCAERTRQGEGRWSRPPKAALERSYLTENSTSANRILRPRRKITPDRIPETKEWLYIYPSILTMVPLYCMLSSRSPRRARHHLPSFSNSVPASPVPCAERCKPCPVALVPTLGYSAFHSQPLHLLKSIRKYNTEEVLTSQRLRRIGHANFLVQSSLTDVRQGERVPS